MASNEWIAVRASDCYWGQKGAQLVERRAYPADFIPFGEPYRLLGRGCSRALACNLEGVCCPWAFTDPDDRRPRRPRAAR